MRTAAVLGAAAFLCAGGAAAQAPAPAAAQENPNARVTPFMMADGLYYVGASDLAAYMISTDAGLIVIDGGLEATAPIILDNLKALGFEPAQVKILLNTHAHTDVAGGLAALKKATGATLYASAEDGAVMATGGKGALAAPFPPVKPDRIVKDGDTVTLGAAVLTAHITPGHTKGCTTWTFPVKTDGVVRQAVVLCTMSVGATQKLTGDPAYPNAAADFAKGFAVQEKLPCEVWMTSRGKAYRRAEKRLAMRPGAPNPFVDPAGCKAFIAEGKAKFEAELKKQQGATTP